MNYYEALDLLLESDLSQIFLIVVIILLAVFATTPWSTDPSPEEAIA